MEPIPTPCDIEAEEAVLGSILTQPSVLPSVQPHLTDESFYLARHGMVWRAVTALAAKGQPLDTLTLARQLDADGCLAEVGGDAYIAQLITSVPTAAHAEYYALAVRNTALRRRVIAVASHIASLAYRSDIEPTHLIQQVAEAIRVTLPSDSQQVMYWEDTFTEFLGWQMQRQEEMGQQKMALPWSALSWVRPLRPGTLCIVAAQSGVGKTMFAEACAEHWAQQGFRVLFCHFELSHQVMIDRRMVRQSGEPMEAVEAGTLTEAMHEATERMFRWPGQVQYYYCNGVPMVNVAAVARNEIRKGRADVVIVDYLQKAPYHEHIRGMNTAQMRGQDVEVLKNLAEGESVRVMLLSQVNREATGQKRKRRDTIRDTGEAEEKANVVIMLDREVLDEPVAGYVVGDHSPILKVRVDKQTIGRTGEVELWTDLPHFRIHDMEHRQLEESEQAAAQHKSWRR